MTCLLSAADVWPLFAYEFTLFDTLKYRSSHQFKLVTILAMHIRHDYYLPHCTTGFDYVVESCIYY